MREGTVCFLKQGDNVLLALIEYSPTQRIWNGIGGWVEEGEAIEDTIVREVQEETYLKFDRSRITKVAEVQLAYKLHVLLTDTYEGELKVREPSLKKLQWFPVTDIPYSQMLPGNEAWLARVLKGKLVKVRDGRVEEVERFDA